MKAKEIFQYTIYPVLMGTASFVILSLLSKGYNYYYVSVPVITVFGTLILFMERILPYEKEWLIGWDWNLDLTYYIVNYGIKIIAQLQFLWLSSVINFPKLFPTTILFWLQVLITLVIIDFYLYVVHKISHNYLFLWKLHSIHHSSERLYFLNGEKRHALHQVLEGAPGIIFSLVIGTPSPVIAAALSILAINMFMQHTNLDYKTGFLKKIFAVAELHRWHHRADYHDAQVNFGAWLTVWDRIAGTYYDTTQQKKLLGKVGIKEEPNFPRTFLRQFLYPFSREIQRKAKQIN